MSKAKKPIEKVLSVDAVKAAYAKTGFRPICEDWGARENGAISCACPAGVVAVSLGLDPSFLMRDGVELVVAEFLGVDEDALSDFTKAVDYGAKAHSCPSDQDAYWHGDRVREALGFGKGEAEQVDDGLGLPYEEAP